jgi:multidrug transporter EmrE-like cation transporter
MYGLAIVGGNYPDVGGYPDERMGNTNSKLHLALGLGLYFISLICLAISFREKNIAVASMMLIIFNVLSLALVSWLYFKEPLSQQQLAGLALGIATIVVMESA